MISLILLATIAAIAVRLAVHMISISSRRGRRPPGPPSDPIIGHLRWMITTEEVDIALYKLSKAFGNIMNLRFPGFSVLVLSTTRPAIDLLDRRGANYSDRPRIPLAQVIGIRDIVGFMNYGDEFRLHRRTLQKYLNKDKIQTADFRASWQEYALIMTRKLMISEGNWGEGTKYFSTAVILEFLSGHRLESSGDEYMELSVNIQENLSKVLKPIGLALVDIFPFMARLPAWIPGNGQVRKAREMHAYVERFKKCLFADVERKIAEGRAKHHFLSAELSDVRNGSSSLKSEQLESLAAAILFGGTETTSSTIATFLAAMILHPEYQARAQEEIDRVIGDKQLPDYRDRGSLPYVEAIVQETFRWRPVTPFSLAHLSREDDDYNGFFIPKSTLVVTNIRAMSLDESVYREPFTFNPTRFLREPEGWNEPRFGSTFGFGRRVCPGKHLVEDTVWVAIATILSVLDISRPLDAYGHEYVPEIQYENGATCHPLPFPCRILPRNEKMESLVSHLFDSVGTGASCSLNQDDSSL